MSYLVLTHVEDGIENVNDLFLVVTQLRTVLSGRDNLKQNEMFFHVLCHDFFNIAAKGKWQVSATGRFRKRCGSLVQLQQSPLLHELR